MTRTWADKKGRDWVMVCDQPGCTTKSEPFPKEPDLELFVERGWFIAALFGDVCPTCLAAGVEPTGKPHRLHAAAVAELTEAGAA